MLNYSVAELRFNRIISADKTPNNITTTFNKKSAYLMNHPVYILFLCLSFIKQTIK